MTRPVVWMSVSGRTTAGGRLLTAGRAQPATAVIAGQSPGRGLFGSKPSGRTDRPVSMMWCDAEWSLDGCVSDRQSAQSRLRRASIGRCSQTRRPGVSAAMGRNSPRCSSGASGLGSKLSICDSPPERKIKTTAFARGSPALAGQGAEGGEVVHAEAEQTDGAGPEGGATREDGMAQRRRRRVHGWPPCGRRRVQDKEQDIAGKYVLMWIGYDGVAGAAGVANSVPTRQRNPGTTSSPLSSSASRR